MNKKHFSNKDITRYYQTSQWLYRLFCYDPSSLGMHFGFWDETTKNRQEAVARENDYVIEAGGITKGMKVLDAGCGVGGTALHIAARTGAKVWGITLTNEQVPLANKYAKQKHLERLVTFSVGDYTHTTFPDNFFDVVVGIESVCYASPKSTFLKEAYRILKPGGRVVVADGYLARPPKGEKEERLIEDFRCAFAMNEFVSGDEMLLQMRESGFVKTHMQDVMDKVTPSVKHFRKLTKLTRLVCVGAKYMPIGFLRAIYENYTALRISGEGYELGLDAYCIHSGEKP